LTNGFKIIHCYNYYVIIKIDNFKSIFTYQKVLLYTGEDLKWLSEAEPRRGVIVNLQWSKRKWYCQHKNISINLSQKPTVSFVWIPKGTNLFLTSKNRWFFVWYGFRKERQFLCKNTNNSFVREGVIGETVGFP
jgi:hypothetical protein